MSAHEGIRGAVAAWLRSAVEDAERRGLPELKPLLEGLAESTIALRHAGWNDVVRVGGEGGREAGRSE